MAVIILGELLLLAMLVPGFDLAGATLVATAGAAGKVFVGVKGHKQQPVDLAGIQSLVGLELFGGANQVVPPVLHPVILRHITQLLMVQRIRIVHQALPAPPLEALGNPAVTARTKECAQK
jgi:hypothetical protein